MSFSLDLSQDVHSVVIPQGTRHLVIVHRQVILLNTPQLCKTRRIHNLENATFSVLPRYITRVPLSRIVQQLLQKVPQQPAIWKRTKNIKNHYNQNEQRSIQTVDVWSSAARSSSELYIELMMRAALDETSAFFFNSSTYLCWVLGFRWGRTPF